MPKIAKRKSTLKKKLEEASNSWELAAKALDRAQSDGLTVELALGELELEREKHTEQHETDQREIKRLQAENATLRLDRADLRTRLEMLTKPKRAPLTPMKAIQRAQATKARRPR